MTVLMMPARDGKSGLLLYANPSIFEDEMDEARLFILKEIFLRRKGC
jgi:hypothetical protein